MSQTATIGLIALCAVSTFVVKAAGPVALGGRRLPARMTLCLNLTAPALFAALVVTQLAADGHDITIGDQTPGVIAGSLLAWRGVPLIPCLLVAAAVTALLRL
jgi:branched-subunit amino acid transport protein